MAILIKPLIKPSKYLLKKKLELKPVNTLIKKSLLDDRAQKLLWLVDAMSKHPLAWFKKEQLFLHQISLERGFRKYQSNLMVDCLLFFISWHKNLPNEAKALNTLAQKIAHNITNQKAESRDCFILENLSQSFSLKIFVSDAQVPKLCHSYQAITTALQQNRLFYPANGRKRLEIICQTRCLTMDFHENDIDLILKRVLYRLL